MLKNIYIPEIDGVSSGIIMEDMMRSKGYSVSDMASFLRVSPQTIYKYLRGDAYPKTDHLLAICHLLGCDVKDLYVYKSDSNIELDDRFYTHILNVQ